MKKCVKPFLIVVSVIAIITIFIICNILKNKDIKIDENEECIATMYYSYMLGIDAGTQYMIYIYNLNNSDYKYITYQSQITIAGSTNKKEYERGIIKSKNELIELDDYFTNRKENNVELYNSLYYLKDNVSGNINELAEELFK